jgi:hypothetical protein
LSFLSLSEVQKAARFPIHAYSGDPNVDAVSAKRIDVNTLECVFKIAGKEVAKWRISVSKDGKTLTFTAEGIFVVYEKQ